MADLTKLKPADKGAPPPVETKTTKGKPPSETNDNLNKPPREAPVKKTKIEFSVPETMANAFSQEAGHRFGFKKGSKSDLFIAMWQEYQDLKAG
ncbi:MAG: hypothetical protein KZQ66_17260 [Candidatus Thiodiazotropha sp. (ex Lucinoma aequizonata)]|nr:hypothetical protein [Candidatus Thiodiazotropha sp. (ex Lucinoma aequizonata)]MCU7888033.1 hypothetical protein [Candidatus Thiodiazotropha sp. (ex Lucinoma aequizonata)]MCU7894388.1 hypothetical protein [Candidatus Thiodiazotropha sp. (ex Lucinoma aequizonata)]MCU7899454.1 hypothetical protein [Candidatus Thiodiazotropha sp. (ex Lucinoma aequizonata)]MCU7903516.1 hypothetical protein [Candidatus Thiodiazotropha sp. (ex Lucinoma aequizonata)]